MYHSAVGCEPACMREWPITQSGTLIHTISAPQVLLSNRRTTVKSPLRGTALPNSRGFPPWRPSDDGPDARGIVADDAVIWNLRKSGHGCVALLREETNSRGESYGKARLESRVVVPGFDGSVRRPVYLREGTTHL
jgi:hypothetical protein